MQDPQNTNAHSQCGSKQSDRFVGNIQVRDEWINKPKCLFWILSAEVLHVTHKSFE